MGCGLGKQKVCSLQASVFLLKMVYGNIYASVSKRRRKWWRLRWSRSVLQIFQRAHACTTNVVHLLLLHKLQNRKGWQVLFVWANAKFTWLGPGFKSMRSNYGLTGDLLMVPLGAQTGCILVGLLRVVFEQSRWCCFGFQEMLLTFQRLRVATSLCAYRYTLVFTELMESLLLPPMLLLLSFCHVFGVRKRKTSKSLYAGGICWTLFSVFYLPVAAWLLILAFFVPGANRWPTQMTCPRSLWSLYL